MVLEAHIIRYMSREMEILEVNWCVFKVTEGLITCDEVVMIKIARDMVPIKALK